MKNFFYLLAILPFAIASCKKNIDNKTTGIVDASANDESSDVSAGFFLSNWQPKKFIVPASENKTVHSHANITVTINPSVVITKISSLMFGNIR